MTYLLKTGIEQLKATDYLQYIPTNLLLQIILLKVVRCKCRTYFKTSRCTCRKQGLTCTQMCGESKECKSINCLNSVQMDIMDCDDDSE